MIKCSSLLKTIVFLILNTFLRERIFLPFFFFFFLSILFCWNKVLLISENVGIQYISLRLSDSIAANCTEVPFFVSLLYIDFCTLIHGLRVT
jgi:hypothetical protein